ncbi:Rqc2 family fibronectin-binding protein [Anaerovorax sp. IOR16]|uniref:Rqc2 family fibronectin-binding protein n=1 Tax=Anaerovorax sp. IOR16 TaxID=2773458 RepID=UPI0019CFB088|nr:NFACT RNA binding domain-containing protein [Anaerovorax sp. IOR16]
MSFDGFVTGAVARQLNQTLSGAKIEKIYQPETDELLFHIHSKKEKYKLYLSSNSSHPRIHFIEEATNNPANPSGFCMLLRKHLQGGRIASIEQRDSERLIEISVDTLNELGFSVNKKLIIEIMGKHSNIILVDLTSNRIIDSIKRVSIDVNRYRQILPGQPYVYPPSQEKICAYTITEEKLSSILEHRKSKMAKHLMNHIQGISPVLAEEICYRAGAANDLEAETLTPKELAPVFRNLVEIQENGNITPVVYLNQEGSPQDFHIYTLSDFQETMESKFFVNVSEAISYYYSHKASSNRIRQKSSDLERTISGQLDKLYLKKQRLCEDIIKAENSDIYRLYGELLTANLHTIENGCEQATVLNYYDNQPLSIPLDPRFSASKNAQRYYKKYGKAKTAIREKNIQLEETNTDIQYLESVLTYVNNAVTFEEIEEILQELIEGNYLRKRKNNYKEKKKKPAPYSYTTSDGFRILVGRNNKENDYLTLKVADRKDYWFHTKDIPGSHVIVFTEGKEITETAILEASALAAYYSKGRQSENVPVDYTKIKFVKKPSGAKPGMVIFTDNHTIYVNPKELNS